MTLLFSPDGKDGSTAIRQDAEIYFGRVDGGKSLTVSASDSTPHAWVQVISGEVSVGNESLTTADGLAIENSPGEFNIEAKADSRLLLFRLR